METKVNVRGGITALEVNGVFCIPKKEGKPSYVRNAASTVASDTGRKFSVSVREDTIVVTRKS